MKMPGFTAEASLVKTQPKTASIRATSGKRDSVIPQARILEGFCIGNGSYCCFKGPDGKWVCAKSLQA